MAPTRPDNAPGAPRIECRAARPGCFRLARPRTGVSACLSVPAQCLPEPPHCQQFPPMQEQFCSTYSSVPGTHLLILPLPPHFRQRPEPPHAEQSAFSHSYTVSPEPPELPPDAGFSTKKGVCGRWPVSRQGGPLGKGDRT